MPRIEDRTTPMMDGELIVVPVAAGARIFAGSIVCADKNGFAVPGSAAADLTYLGRAEEQVDNASGANGDMAIPVRRKKAFLFGNSSGSDEITQSELGKTCFIEDDETVARSDGNGSRPACGIVLGIEDSGVWVE